MTTIVRCGLAALAAAALAACAPGPEPIAYGRDACEHCHMVIADERYGAELVTRRGRVHRFDSVECLAAFALGQDPGRVHSLWVTDYRSPSRLVRVQDAFFLHDDGLRSPMGLNLTAFGDGVSRASVANAFPGEIMDWRGVLALVRREWPGGRPRTPAPSGHPEAP